MTLKERILFIGAESLLVDSEAELLEELADDHAIKFVLYVEQNPSVLVSGLQMAEILKMYKKASNL